MPNSCWAQAEELEGEEEGPVSDGEEADVLPVYGESEGDYEELSDDEPDLPPVHCCCGLRELGLWGVGGIALLKGWMIRGSAAECCACLSLGIAVVAGLQPHVCTHR